MGNKEPEIVDTTWHDLDQNVVTTVEPLTSCDDEGNVIEVGVEHTPCLVNVRGNYFNVMDVEEFREKYERRNRRDGVG